MRIFKQVKILHKYKFINSYNQVMELNEMEVIDEIMNDEEQYETGTLCLNWRDIPDQKNQDTLHTDHKKQSSRSVDQTRLAIDITNCKSIELRHCSMLLFSNMGIMTYIYFKVNDFMFMILKRRFMLMRT